jgi:arsenate reductase
MLKIYILSNCDTCRRAVKWLRGHEVEFEEHAIRETPPTLAELRAVLRHRGGAIGKLFNTSGKDYREQKLGEKLPAMTEAQALALLAKNGNLVKRPFAVGEGVALTGFDEAEWTAAVLRR